MPNKVEKKIELGCCPIVEFKKVLIQLVLEVFKKKLPSELYHKLKLPIIYLQQGKLWVGRAIAYSFMKKYPPAVQIAVS
ncbi:hypothetical protein Mpsy_1658 [Methanolobus psychrophilus R15]|nr:hypothetical protein Mpsy_1658 [Methanolobus psychrophilus R15]